MFYAGSTLLASISLARMEEVRKNSSRGPRRSPSLMSLLVGGGTFPFQGDPLQLSSSLQTVSHPSSDMET